MFVAVKTQTGQVMKEFLLFGRVQYYRVEFKMFVFHQTKNIGVDGFLAVNTVSSQVVSQCPNSLIFHCINIMDKRIENNSFYCGFLLAIAIIYFVFSNKPMGSGSIYRHIRHCLQLQSEWSYLESMTSCFLSDSPREDKNEFIFSWLNRVLWISTQTYTESAPSSCCSSHRKALRFPWVLKS